MRRLVVVAAAAAAVMWGWGTARAQMMGGASGRGHGAPGYAGRMAGSWPAARSCWGDLGLSPQAEKTLEEKSFELRKKEIRGRADLAVLRLELAQLLDNRTFDLQAAEKLLGEISQKEAQLRSAHLTFLHDMGSLLSKEQWNKLMERHGGMMGFGGMMPMMGDRGPRGGPYMRGGMMPGWMMDGRHQGREGMMDGRQRGWDGMMNGRHQRWDGMMYGPNDGWRGRMQPPGSSEEEESSPEQK